MKKKYILLFVACIISLCSYSQKWVGLGEGTGGIVFAIDTFQHNIYAGGNFTNAGGVSVNSIAYWDGSAWHALGSGVGGDVYALAVYNGKLIVGGEFTSAGGDGTIQNIAQWDGTSWSGLGTGVTDDVNALIVYKGNLIASGAIITAGGIHCNSIAQWNGTNWSPLGSGLNGQTYALTVYNNNLYAGGDADSAGGVLAYQIARWNGTVWDSVGHGVTDTTPHSVARITQLVTYKNNVYALGGFTKAGSVPAVGLAKWNDTSGWSAAKNMGNQSYVMTVSNNNLYAAVYTGLGYTSGVVQWNGSAWDTLQGTFSVYTSIARIYTLFASDSELFAAGDFNRIGPDTVNSIVQWNLLTGINELRGENAKVKVYPNPSTGIVNFVIANGVQQSQLEVYNMLGEKVQSFTINHSQFTIDLSAQPIGIYFYRITDENGTSVASGKLVKE